MGYNTEFKGELKFKNELTGTQLAKLKSFFGEDRRDHPEWNAPDDFYYVDLVFLDDFSGIEWDETTEKTYGMVEMVNTITENMRREWPDFCLRGKLLAQGEDIADRWELVIDEHGIAKGVEVPHTGSKVTCPHCEGHFYL